MYVRSNKFYEEWKTPQPRIFYQGMSGTIFSMHWTAAQVNMVTGENVEKRRLDGVENRDVMLEILNNWKGQGYTSLARYDM